MKTIVDTFYKVFINLDADGMTACYHGAVVFEDPAFGVLKGPRATAIW